MRKTILQLLLVQILAAGLFFCPGLSAQDSDKPLTNTDIIQMAKAGVRESVILSSIQMAPAKYDLSPAGISTLRRAGVSQKVLDAMAGAAGQPAASPQATALPTPSPSQSASSRRRAPTVTLTEDGRMQDLPKERTQLLQTKTKPTSMTRLASDSALAQAVQGGISTATQEATSRIHSSAGSSTVGQATTIFGGMLSRHKPATTYVWALANPTSANVLQGDQPSFTVDFSRVLNIKADDFAPAVIKLTPAPTGQYTCRLVGATQGKEDALSSFATDWEVYSGFMEDRVAIQSQKIAPGKFKISVPAPLSPGEYGVVLRPLSKSKKFSGGDIERNQSEGLLFNSVWSFQVPNDDN